MLINRELTTNSRISGGAMAVIASTTSIGSISLPSHRKTRIVTVRLPPKDSQRWPVPVAGGAGRSEGVVGCIRQVLL